MDFSQKLQMEKGRRKQLLISTWRTTALAPAPFGSSHLIAYGRLPSNNITVRPTCKRSHPKHSQHISTIMLSTNYFTSLLPSTTHATTSRYIYLAAALAAAVCSYSLVAKTNNNKSLTTSKMAPSTTTTASNTNSTDMNGVPRVLHEIGDLMRHMFFEMRDLLYERSVTSVEIIDKDHKYRKISMKKREDHIVCSPLILGSGGEEEWDNMEAVFAYMMCGYSVAWMWDVLKLLVKGKLVTFPRTSDCCFAAPCSSLSDSPPALPQTLFVFL